ncbi:MAG TPA: capsid cement protein [Chthonomonas sp.]|uniref:capsid cement protein n=1 Tax=Chthonomonas sp. TaxID=2282153 RepID=UPI002B4AEFBB|nr:capsid cement protein [Chthonomonas sp.]HLI49854.1 capsid cement protein [Chthonomonas sp.]
MAASTGPREAQRKPGQIVAYKMGAVRINKGTLVVAYNADGYAYPARAGAATTADNFLGVAYETIDNSGGPAGAQSIRVQKTGTYVFALPSASQTLVGDAVYALDDQTLTTNTTNSSNPNTLVGYVVGVEDANDVRIRIDAAVR